MGLLARRNPVRIILVLAALHLTVLSTMLADTVAIGEWGFAALVEADGYTLLFDTGERHETVLRNAAEMASTCRP